MARPLSLKYDNTHNNTAKINISVSTEIKRFLIENNLSPSDIIARHVENLRELATHRYEKILKEKDEKILKLTEKISSLYEKLNNEFPEILDKVL